MIHIGAKFRPFSHRIGARFQLPGTDLIVETARQKILIGSVEIPLNCDLLENPFTLQQDLEKGQVKIFGKNFGLEIQASLQGIIVRDRCLKKSQVLSVASTGVPLPSRETLFLGSHKAQDLDMLLRRFDLEELLPLFYRLSQVQSMPVPKQTSVFSHTQLKSWVYQAFSDFLIAKTAVWEEVHSMIRSQFIKEEAGNLELLPNRFFAKGRFINVQTSFGQIDFEWTKHTLRRAVLHVSHPATVQLEGRGFCRIRFALHEKGTLHDLSVPLVLRPGIVFLDRYETSDC